MSIMQNYGGKDPVRLSASEIREAAIREFAEELKALSETRWYHDAETGITVYRIVYVTDIDDLVSEMTRSEPT